MNYMNIYNKLIDKAKQREFNNKGKPNNNIYTERHHIKPRSMGGDNSNRNLVDLTAREHYLAHALLVKITEKKYKEHPTERNKEFRRKMLSAFNIMKASSSNQNRITNSKLFDIIRSNSMEALKIYDDKKLNKMFKFYVDFDCGKNQDNYKIFQELFDYHYERDSANRLFSQNDLHITNSKNVNSTRYDTKFIKQMFEYYIINNCSTNEEKYKDLQEKFNYNKSKSSLTSLFHKNKFLIREAMSEDKSVSYKIPLTKFKI